MERNHEAGAIHSRRAAGGPAGADPVRTEPRPVVAPLDLLLEDMPPGLNNAYRTAMINGQARRVLTGAARKWKNDAIKQIKAAAGRAGWSLAKKVPITISILYRAPNILVWDLDGKVKLLQDAAMEALGLDDRYVMDMYLSKRRYPSEQVYMRISEWSQS